MLSHLGEALYWQGDFEQAASALQRALDLAPADAQVRTQAGRYLGDIELSVRGDRDRAGELFAAALSAARELGDPWALARTLLVAGWGPYWRDDHDGARAMFEEALEVARSNPKGDPWAEARALASLAGLVAETGDEEEALALGSRALVVAEGKRDRFSIAAARENVAGALRRLGRLDEALEHAEAAVRGFRELGAKWELASALTSLGIVRRLRGETDQAVRDLHEAYRLVRELKERSIVGWTAGSYAKTLVDAGDLGKARRVLAETAGQVSADGRPEWVLDAEIEMLLAEGDRDGALASAQELLQLHRRRGFSKDVAATVWWIGQVFGPEPAGGPDEVDRARGLLERLHVDIALRRPDLVASRYA
jgi:tetratricopeptide (TPR) repeat protein